MRQKVCELDPDNPVGCCCAWNIKGGGLLERQRACNEPFVFTVAQDTQGTRDLDPDLLYY